MNNPSGTVAVLDTNVLVPDLLRDVLLRAANAGVYTVRWSEQILEELYRTLVSKGFTTEVKATRTLAAMRGRFLAAPITGYESLMEQMTNDPKDRHILAAASHVGAGCIVTFNLRHFSAATLAFYGLRAVSPDAFLCERFAEKADAMIAVLREIARERTRPRRSATEIVGSLAPLTPRFVAAVQPRLTP